jgi:hypothetical protein
MLNTERLMNSFYWVRGKCFLDLWYIFSYFLKNLVF